MYLRISSVSFELILNNKTFISDMVATTNGLQVTDSGLLSPFSVVPFGGLHCITGN